VFEDLKSAPAAPDAPEVAPEGVFNIIYSSGTTGVPKGIVQSNAMRDAHVELARSCGYDFDSVTLVSTPLYSNTTLVSFLPTIALGGTAVLMRKFDAGQFLALSERHRVTHAMLVPVQYRRLMEFEKFGDFDLSSYREKFCTSAPFPAELKHDVLARWPGGLTEYYGMTEGGGLCILFAHEHPDKLHTVGRPAPDNDIRVIDEDGKELPPGEKGEIVGRSRGMMLGYHNRPETTSAAYWISPEGKRFMRSGDVGRFDEDGFLILMDRKKDVIISGGFNIYPSDLEDIIRSHPDVVDAAVVGITSKEWGETPAAFVVAREGNAEAIRAYANQRLGKLQRISRVQLVEQLPRNAIGKVLKRELRENFYDKEGLNQTCIGTSE
jgi:acyl-CoA synthetase (AMP-forming)/AMP-acid ligase II